MNRKQKIQSAVRILRSRFTSKRIPVAVRWNLLHRCPSRCAYCNLWRTPAEEMTFEEIRPLLGQLARLGTTQISFSGGEPLLREDIGEIVEETARVGISPTMNSSGFGLKKRLASLGRLDQLKISLDGPEEIHDQVRNRPGAFKTALEAAELGSENLRRISFATTITRYNVHNLDFMLRMAERFATTTAFQPLKTLYRGVRDEEQPVPAADDYRRAVDLLITEKRRGNRHIRNSMAELERMRHWPDYPPLTCGAGRIFVMIDPDGTLRRVYPAVKPKGHAATVLADCREIWG